MNTPHLFENRQEDVNGTLRPHASAQQPAALRTLQAVAAIAVLVGLFVLSRQNFLMFHGLAELFSIAVAWSLFLLVWSSRRIISNDALLFIGIAYGFIGLIDLVHTMAYKGMGVLPPAYSANTATQLWIAARGLEGASLLLFPVLLGRQRFSGGYVFWGFAALTASVLGCIFLGDVFPDCYIKGQGLTAFKKGAEYAICLALVLAMALLYHRRERLDVDVFRLMVAAMAVTVMAELAFTFYVSVYGLSNVAGHLFKIVSFYLVYLALVRASVARPQATVFQGLELDRTNLAEDRRQLRLLHQTSSLFLESGTLDDTIGALPQMIADHYAVPIVAIELYDAARKEMVFAGAAGIPKAEGRRLRVPVDQTISGAVAISGRAVIDLNVCEHADYRAEALRELDVVTFACVPLIGQEGVIGTLAIADREKRPDIMDGANLLKALADSLAQEIERHRQAEAYRLLVENANTGFVLFDTQGRYLALNQYIADMLGVRPADIVGKSLHEVLPDEADFHLKRFKQIMEEKKGARYEDSFQLPGGTRWFNSDLQPVFNTSGDVTGIQIVTVDVSKRRQAEERLRESEDNYRHLFETMTQGVVLQDAEGKIIEANRAAGEILGLTQDQLFGRTAYDPRWKLIREDGSPYDPNEMPSNIALRTGKPVENVLCGIYVPEKDEYRWILIGSSPRFRDGESEPSLTMTVFADITDRKTAQSELREREAYYRGLIHNLHEDILVIDKHHRISDINNTALQHLGLSREAVIGRHCYEVSHGWDAPCQTHGQACSLQRVLETGEACNLAHDHLDADGKITHVDILSSPLRDENGNITHVIEAVRDVTDLLNARQAVAESEKKYQDLFNKNRDGYVINKGSGEILDPNPAYARMLGYGLDEIKTVSFWDLTPEKWIEWERDVQGRKLLERGYTDLYEKEYIRKDGTVFPVELQAFLLNDPVDLKGAMIGAFVRDITERKQAESDQANTLRMLEILNAKTELRGLMKSLLAFMQELSGCEAVGIRLRDGDDFPYYESSGFSDEFVEAERHLCARDLQGQLLRDEMGNPVLECMCGNIICRRFDPSLPFFTEFGSFVSNGTSKLLAATTEEDRQARTRNRCNAEGYESVMLVPLSFGDEPFGLLQFNDRREDRFAPRLVAQIERMAGNVAIALAQRKADAALKESLERLKGFDLHSSEGMYRIDMARPVPLDLTSEDMRAWINRHAVVGEVNDSLARMYGLTPKDMIGRPATDFAPNYGERALQVLARADRRVINEETEDVDRDGTPVYLIENYHGVVEGGFLHAIWGAQRDITERKLAEAALQDERQRLKGIIQGTNAGTWEWNVPTGQTIFNERWAEIVGYTLDELSPVSIETWRNLAHPEDLKVSDELLEKHFRGVLDYYECEARMKHKNGYWVWVLDRGRVVHRAEDGKPLVVMGTHQDISDRKTAETRLQQAQKMESIGTLAGGIAHDFNNILFPIVGMSELLLEDLPSDSLEYENAAEILKAGKRGRDLVQQILAFSRQTDQRLMPVRPQQVLKEVARLTRSTIPANINVSHSLQSDCGPVLLDPTRLHQIAMNLITNAYHAVEQTNGSLSMTLQEIDTGVDQVSASQLKPGRYALLTVSDTGPGIDSEHLDKIFDPYFTTKKHGKGTGLGLSVVYGIVKEHGGDITVNTEIGRGTTFQVYLPLILNEAEPIQAMPLEILPTGNERILLVDDEPAVLALEKQMLGRLGYQVTDISSSTEALNFFSASPSAFDLVISDMAMPEMTGDNLARRLIEIRPDIPIIICTGFSERIDKEKVGALGIKELLMKPVVKSQMAETIRKVLEEVKIDAGDKS